MGISQEYLEEIWREAKKALPGWMYAALHSHAKAVAGGRSAHRKAEPSALELLAITSLNSKALGLLEDEDVVGIWAQFAGWYLGAIRGNMPTDMLVQAARRVMDDIQRRELAVKPTALGSEVLGLEKAEASIAFVSACPDASSEFLGIFKAKYLQPLGLSEGDVWQFDIVPEEMDPGEFDKCVNDWMGWAEKRLEDNSPRIIVSLGKAAKAILGPTADFSLPHPSALAKFHDSGEVGRKLKQIAKRLAVLDTGLNQDNTVGNSPSGTGETPAETTGDNTGRVERAMMMRIAKADASKHIVFGVVMDPYGAQGTEPDAHKDYLPPSTIEETAHNFMQGDRVIGRQHESKANAVVVESSIEQYPSSEDYQKAVRGEDHRVLRRAFGDDVIHSGSWILGVKLGEEEWRAFERGELNAFSPGGIGYRQGIEPSEMPNVTFIDLVEQAL